MKALSRDLVAIVTSDIRRINPISTGVHSLTHWESSPENYRLPFNNYHSRHFFFYRKFLIVGGWVLLVFLAYRVSQFDYEMANFDPYEILNIPVGASVAEVKKQYRKLSLVYHPDKETGNEKLFMKLTKGGFISMLF